MEQSHSVKSNVVPLRWWSRWLPATKADIEKLRMTLDQVLQSVTDESTLDDSIITLLTGIKAQLDAVLKGGLSAADQAKVDAIFAAAEANKAKVAAAVTANTDVQPPT